jgi:hypothetical protein
MNAFIEPAGILALGLLAEGFGFLVILAVMVGISLLFDWLKKKAQQPGADGFDPTDFSVPRTKPASNTEAERSLSEWEEQIRRLLQAEQAPPQPPTLPPPIPARSPRPIQPLEEGMVEDPVPTHLSTFETPDAGQTRAGQLSERVQSQLENIGHGIRAAAALARADKAVEASVSDRLNAAGGLPAVRPSTIATPTAPRLSPWAEALRSPVQARSAIVAAVILGPPKSLE